MAETYAMDQLLDITWVHKHIDGLLESFVLSPFLYVFKNMIPLKSW